MNLTKRLVISTLVIPIFIAVLWGYFGIKQSDDADKRHDYFISTSIPTIELLELIRFTAAKHDAMLSRAVLTYKEDQYVLEQLSALRAAIEALQSSFSNEYVTNETDKKLNAEDQKLIQSYMTAVEKTVKLIEKGDAAGAKNLLVNEVTTEYMKLDKALRDHSSYANKLAIKFQEVGKESSRTNLMIQLGSVVGFVLILGLMGYVNFIFIMRTLGGDPVVVARAVRTIAERDLSKSIHTKYRGSLIDKLESMRINLSESITKLSEDTKQLVIYAESLASASHQVASSANNGSDNAARMAASAEEMTINISNVSESANVVSQKVSEAGGTATRGGQSIIELTECMAAFSISFKHSVDNTLSLSHQSDEIKYIVEEIKDIAEQTNLLALNAAIEAARAGDSGRGFAVVADEVRKLAERTKRSTEDIASKIQAIQKNVHTVVSAMNQNLGEIARSEALAERADHAVREIRLASDTTVSLVSEISQAISVNSETSRDVSKTVENFASLSEENSAAAKEVAITASELSKLAESLSQLTSTFKTS